METPETNDDQPQELSTGKKILVGCIGLVMVSGSMISMLTDILLVGPAMVIVSALILLQILPKPSN